MISLCYFQTTVPPSSDGTLSTVAYKDRILWAFHLNGRYSVLLEEARRSFFHNHSIESFVHCIEHRLHLPVTYLTAAQERFFVKFYRLPKSALKCTKLMLFDDFTKNYWRIVNIFASLNSPTIDIMRSDDVIGRNYNASCDVSRKRSVDEATATDSTLPVGQSDLPETRREKRLKKKIFAEVIVID